MVNTTHQEYANSLKKWTFCRDIIDGDDAIKAKKTVYVPRLSEQSDDEYYAMLNRPSFENYTARTLDGMSGLIFSKHATIEVPKKLEETFSNIDLDGSTLTDLSQRVVDNIITVGRVGLLIDMPSVDTKGMTRAEVEALNIRPYMKTYNTESIINWRYTNINNNNVLSMVVLKENKEIWEDEFTKEDEEIYRVLSLDDEIYTVRIFEKIKDDYVVTQEFTPKMNGNLMSRIPFIGISPMELTLSPTKPPLYDLAKVNLTHFKTNVEYYHGMHFTAIPTPYGSGIHLDDDVKIKVGSTTFIMFDLPDAKLEYLEFKGDGLGTLDREKQTLKQTMVTLGSNMLQGDKNVAEAEKTVAMRNAGQNASLTSIADTASRGITMALELMAEWMNLNGKVSYSLNTDYNLTQMDAQMLRELTNSLLAGGITQRMYFNNLKRGEIAQASQTFDDYKTELEEETPQLSEPPQKADNAK